MAVDRESPEFLRFYARVMIREYRARGPRARWMLDGALKARRQAAINARRLAEANLPAQQDLFA